ncbi:MAG: lysylphosphatidylglycerol synthase domain-containing protein [Parvibaculum sp.]|uniref:lysylphosphatidylglycerol synthase domain-containing protein n=1 Tax=Parvibaculum sp. TaxID=2024848 RepID=UPI0025D6C7E4|nr:lysylphosphatidylglycerol synthase domain-containing protein [Parvibaculum sp.]MCE9648735.1 lysylphosphatidylglycerol synthase domain-containing protein [Parvibaculum sp.]
MSKASPSWRFWSHALPPAIAAVILLVAVFVLYRQFEAISLVALVGAIREQPLSRIAVALALTAVSFLALSTYDVFAARTVVPGRVSWARGALAGAAGNAVANTLGFHAVTGSAVRYRLYKQAGLGLADTARIVSLSWAALGLGFVSMLAVALLAAPVAGGGWTAATIRLQAVGVALAVALCALINWLSRGSRSLSLGPLHVDLPPVHLAALQMGIGAVEMGAAIGALYILLPADLAPSFAAFAVATVASILLGVVAHSPGGIGVFEASIVSLLGGAGRADLLAALLLYRLIYNLLPFVLSLAALGLFEVFGRHGQASSNADNAE